MKMKRWALGLLALAWVVPGSSGAFSFLAGGFAAGEKIESIQLSAGLSGAPSVTFDTTTNKMTFVAAVSTITTSVATYGIPIGDVMFASSITLVAASETVIAPIPFIFSGLMTGDFLDGLDIDLSITDIAGGSALLLAADYSSALAFKADGPAGFGLPVTGAMAGDFILLGGADANFTAAFGSTGKYSANLTNFISNGFPVTTDLCVLITPPCVTGLGTIDNFTVNPTATIVPLSVPEPGSLALFGIGSFLLSLSIRRATL